jgi:hypothetical protein
MTSLLFTLKNPNKIRAHRFALKATAKGAICCASVSCANFGDICVADHCDAHARSLTSLGVNYTNDTGHDGSTIFTGAKTFRVKEIEVFELAA